jgi:antirestriction protein ArdC
MRNKLSSGPWKVAIGADQAMENWMVATLGASIEHGDETVFVTTDHVHASEAESYPFEDAEFIVKCRNYAHEHGDPLAMIESLQKQDEVHWKTRRSLLAEIEKLRASTACEYSDSGQHECKHCDATHSGHEPK